MQAFLITGNTYPVRRELRAAGCLFDRDEMGYIVAADKAEPAKQVAEQRGLTVEPYDATDEQLTPATGERLRAIREDKRERRRERLLARADAADRRADKHNGKITRGEREFLQLCEPVKIGHHSQRRHEKLIKRARDAFFAEGEERVKAQDLRRKADWLAPVLVKGDTERKRQEKRDAATAAIAIGDTVSDPMFGVGVVLRVNTKTFTVNYPERGFRQAVDKSWCKLVAKGTGAAKLEHKFKAGDLVTATRLLAKYEGTVKRRTSRGYSVQYVSFGRTYTETFAECDLVLRSA